MSADVQHYPDGLFDGRQSEMARDIARGATRWLAGAGLAALPEVTLANGRRADLMAVSQRSDIWIVEIKSSIEDFRSDQKWPDYQGFCDRFFFAVHPSFPHDILPPSTGLILADRYGGEMLRQMPPKPISGARRKAVLTGFGVIAAARLAALADPQMLQETRGIG